MTKAWADLQSWLIVRLFCSLTPELMYYCMVKERESWENIDCLHYCSEAKVDLVRRWTRDVQIQASRVVIQPGFLISRVENHSNFSLERARIFLEERNSAGLQLWRLCASRIRSVAIYFILQSLASLILSERLNDATFSALKLCRHQNVWSILALLQLHKCFQADTPSLSHLSYQLLPDQCKCPPADLGRKFNLCTKWVVLIASEFTTIQLCLLTNWCKLIGF